MPDSPSRVIKTQPSPTTPPKPKRSGSVAPRSVRGRIAAGVLIIIPLAVTMILIRYVYDAALAVGVWLVYWVLTAAHVLIQFEGEPKVIDPANAEFREKAVAVVLTILMLYLMGWLGTNVVGRRLISFVESLLAPIPLVASIYSSIKRMVEALSGAGKDGGADQRAVLVDFPHENMKAVALMTNVITDRTTGGQYATVFVPTTPNPTSGYMVLVPIDRITYTDWSLEEAISMILSSGAGASTEATFTPSAGRQAGGGAESKANKSKSGQSQGPSGADKPA
jgi:uncharacterized membrane protein